MSNVVTKAYQLLRQPYKSKTESSDTDTNDAMDTSRRSFIGGLVGASGLAVAPV